MLYWAPLAAMFLSDVRYLILLELEITKKVFFSLYETLVSFFIAIKNKVRTASVSITGCFIACEGLFFIFLD